MSVTVVCECTNTFSLKDEYAGMMVKCPRCGASVRAGSAALTPASEADPIYRRNVFLLRQQAPETRELPLTLRLEADTWRADPTSLAHYLVLCRSKSRAQEHEAPLRDPPK